MWDESLEAHRDETRAFNQQLATLLADVPGVEIVGAVRVREMRDSGEGPFPAAETLDHAEDRVFAGVPVRVIVPDRVRGIYLHIHGGGWALGDARAQDPALDRIATRAQVAVVSVQYPLAPEDPYPAGPDACERAALWVLDNMSGEFGTDRLVIGGESAGAHLSAVTILRLRDRHDALEDVVGANLVYGCFDLTGTPGVRGWTENLILSPGNLRYFFDSFLPDRDEAARRDPDISPLYAELGGLPPALFTVGTRDPLFDDSVLMHARWLTAGNRAELAVYPDAVHGFDAFAGEMGAAARERTDAFIAAAVR